MHSRKCTIAVCLLAMLATAGHAQGPVTPVHNPVFERLEDSQWIRLAGPDIGRRQGRVAEHSATEIVLTSDAQPLRLPATAVDTVWTRGRSTVAGLIVGAIVFGALGAVAGTALGEENAGSGRNVLSLAGMGAVGGAAFGGAVGSLIPRWQRQFP
jgi:hypothetical protein